MIRRVIVCGSRDWTDTGAVYSALDRLHCEIGFDVVIEGDGRGVDRIAGYWARRKGLDNRKFKALWNTRGKAAGPIRNARMINEGRPDAVIYFPGGDGTADMRRRAERAGLEIISAMDEP